MTSIFLILLGSLLTSVSVLSISYLSQFELFEIFELFSLFFNILPVESELEILASCIPTMSILLSLIKFSIISS